MQVDKLKILLIGPSDCGKTSIANYLSDSINTEEAAPPRPTQGARILEFDVPLADDTRAVEVELWDCSGDHKFEPCWPALRAGAAGALLASGSGPGAARELELLFGYFVRPLGARRCLLLHAPPADPPDLSPTFAKVSRATVNLQTGGDRLKTDFANFVTSILQTMTKVNK